MNTCRRERTKQMLPLIFGSGCTLPVRHRGQGSERSLILALLLLDILVLSDTGLKIRALGVYQLMCLTSTISYGKIR